jgi:hypothetical protein
LQLHSMIRRSGRTINFVKADPDAAAARRPIIR